MLTPSLADSVRVLAACLLFACIRLTGVAAPKWAPITAADRDVDISQLDTSSGVVVLLKDVTSDQGSGTRTALNIHIRMMVLSEKGVGAMRKIDIPFVRGRSIRDLAARVVTSDGRIIEVDPKSFHSREIIRVGKAAQSVKSFAFAGLEPGCIAEYRYRVRSSSPLEGMLLELDEQYPVALTRLKLRPFSLWPYSTSVVWSPDSNLVVKGSDNRRFNLFEAVNIPPLADEPAMPPPVSARPWLAYFLSYGDADVHWFFEGAALSRTVREEIKPTKRLTKAAESITAGAADTEEKIARLYEHCRTKIKNLSYDTCGYTPEEIEDLEPNSSAMDVLTHGYGTSRDINLLFAALLRALGAECGLALCNDHSRCFFDRKLTMVSTLPDLLVALRKGDSWRFYDPGALYLPMGKLKWRNENTTALVADKDLYQFIRTKPSPSDYSTTKRVARLRLTEEGTIEGDVEITHEGHAALDAKDLFDAKSAEQSAELVTNGVRERLPDAVISKCVVHDADDPEKPLRITYHVRVENYAEATGDRLFVQPAFFQKGVPPRFPSATRRLPAYFDYFRSEHDEVTLELPPGFEREVESVPQTHGVDEQFFYLARFAFSEDGNQAVYTRKFSQELGLVPVEGYRVLKACFDFLHEQDSYTITLKRKTTPSAAVGETVTAAGGS